MTFNLSDLIDPKMLVALAIGALGAFAAKFVASLARDMLRKVTTDKDPANDWQAPLWRALAQAAAKGDMDEVKNLTAKLEKK